MKTKHDINQLELDLSAADTKVAELTQQLRQTKLDLREAKVERKDAARRLVLARSAQLKDVKSTEIFRDRIRRNVVSYCLSEGIDLSDAWTYLYELLRKATGVNPFALGLGSRASRLEHVQKAGLLSELFSLLPTLEKLKPEKIAERDQPGV